LPAAAGRCQAERVLHSRLCRVRRGQLLEHRNGIGILAVMQIGLRLRQ